MKPLGLIIAIGAVLYGLYSWKYPTYTYRYRMTVNVETPGGVRSGSSVIEVKVSKQPQFLPDVLHLKYSVRGEAVFVDLGTQQNVVAVLASGPFAEDFNYPELVLLRHLNLSLSDEVLSQLPSLRGRWQLKPAEAPSLVTFSNPNDAASGRVVRLESLEQEFGPGVRLVEVSVETTEALVTGGELQKKLPFLIAQRERLYRAYSEPNKFTPQYHMFIRGG